MCSACTPSDKGNGKKRDKCFPRLIECARAHSAHPVGCSDMFKSMYVVHWLFDSDFCAQRTLPLPIAHCPLLISRWNARNDTSRPSVHFAIKSPVFWPAAWVTNLHWVARGHRIHNFCHFSPQRTSRHLQTSNVHSLGPSQYGRRL